MKSKIIAIFTMCLVLLNCTPVFANTGANTIIGSEKIDETVVERENYIFNSVNDMLESEDKSHLDENSIDYSKMIREFSGLNIFESNKLTKAQMKTYTDDQETVYLLPAHHDGVTVLSTLKIRKPLTEETKEKLTDEDLEFYENQTGKWYISVTEVRPRIVDHKETVENILKQNNLNGYEIYFVSGICSHIDLAAIICNDNPDDTRILILEQYGAETGLIDKTGAFENQIILDKDTLYTYDEIKAIVDKDKEEQQNIPEGAIGSASALNQTTSSTPDNNKIIIVSVVSGVAVLAIVIAAICIVKKKSKEKVQ